MTWISAHRHVTADAVVAAFAAFRVSTGSCSLICMTVNTWRQVRRSLFAGRPTWDRDSKQLSLPWLAEIALA